MIFKKECILEPSETVEIYRVSEEGFDAYRISINAGWPDESVTVITRQSMIELRDALNKEFPVGCQEGLIDTSTLSGGDYAEHPLMMKEAYRLDLLPMSHKFYDRDDLQGWCLDPSYGGKPKKTSPIKKLFKKWIPGEKDVTKG